MGRQDEKKQLKRGEGRMKKIVEERGRQNEKKIDEDMGRQDEKKQQKRNKGRMIINS